ncbi:putative DNA-binding transcriptional regulator AlpA [Rhizobium aethiopicum]|uniref:Putative DNA-binding transcriptional regulator AlpA n=1 Tax=Rhizobium aethiopicum TaxID=1138170 RepID=A0A7W6QAM6_9HYPH|nr:AlpA family phage regulatory protein [Rhizobium aethiopicum]MBB4194047.1 putative DNA-binding transcriptional regulator AlpA [Rhizobium aethiopicum]MBB4581232.1 putative DNA-binding transcriptional regulator AlpA [Rhizobium aethiopicum]
MTATDRFIRLADVQEMIGLKDSRIYQMIKAGEFPKPIKLGASSRWSLRAVEAWMSERANAA